jgi:hypothetical protein
MKIIGTVLGIIALIVLGLVAESSGYGNVVASVVVLATLAIVVYAFKSRSPTKRT